MGSISITVRAFNGSLADLQGGNLNQVGFNDIGPPIAATINTTDGTLNSGAPATFTRDGSGQTDALTYIGSGTIFKRGIGNIPLFSKGISAFEVDDQVYFYTPDGLPPLSAVTASVIISADTPLKLDGFVPGFACGTRIVTRRGNVLVEDIRPGEVVLDTSGHPHAVLWAGSTTINLTSLCDDQYQKLVPVRIRADVTREFAPFDDLIVPQQNRVQLRHPMTETLFKNAECFAPAVTLVGHMAEFAMDMETVTYHHLHCAKHITLLANGVEAENLFIGDAMRPARQDAIGLGFAQSEALASAPNGETARLTAHIIAGPHKGRRVPIRPTAYAGKGAYQRPVQRKWENSPYPYQERCLDPAKPT